MPKPKYATSPVPSSSMPKGIPYIIGNEAAERFSFYGMKGILYVFMTQYLMGQDGQLALMNDSQAMFWYHQFTSLVYFTPFLGALISDIFFGKYKTIIWLSLVYCLGHLVLTLDETRLGLAVGLALITMGSGGIKPCVSAHVGDQFGQTNQHLLGKVFGWFYFSINLGAAISTWMIPILLDKVGPQVAFGLPGLLMFIATFVFWLGRRKFVHIPPSGLHNANKIFDKEGLVAISRLLILYLFFSMFWALFDQTGSAWVKQSQNMDRHFLFWELLPSQIQAANPIMIMILIPTCVFVIYPLINKIFPLTPLRKITIGFFMATAAFVISALIQEAIDNGQSPNIIWQLLAYMVLTVGEVMVSITGLEFSYTQAPKRMKSLVMSAFFFSIFLGNQFTSLVNLFIQNVDGSSKLPGSSYYWFFTALMLGTAIFFIPLAKVYKEKTYIQDDIDQNA